MSRSQVEDARPEQCSAAERATKGKPANIPAPRRHERSGIRSVPLGGRVAAERTVGNGFWFEDVPRRAGVGSLTTLRRKHAGIGSSAERALVAEKGRRTRGLRWRRGARENSNERIALTARSYPEPHQVSEVSSLWPNGRKQAREIGKMDPYLRYKG